MTCRLAIALTLVCLAGLPLLPRDAAAHDAIHLRRKFMKAIGSAAKDAQEMVRGRRTFDAAKAASSMSLLARVWPEVEKLFPVGSETGAQTRAAPAVWSSFDDFVARGRSMADLAGKAEAEAAAGLERFQPAFEAVAKTCKGCHRSYMTRD